MSTPRIDKATWTFGISGPCAYCGKKANRTVTFHDLDYESALVRANRAQDNIAHRKCQGF